MEMEKFGKILVVDDNADVLFTINNQLAPRCEWVRVAYTPERALMLCKKYKPDVVLMDMNFTRDAVSGEEGFQLLRDMLKIDKDLAVIMMTAYSDTPKVVRAIKAGATDFLPKPWERSQLMTMLSSAMQLKGLGYNLGLVNPFDGKFAAKTDAAVRSFQKAQGLTVDGIVGENTWKRLLGIYMPWMKLDGQIPFYSEGEGWQRQHHRTIPCQ